MKTTHSTTAIQRDLALQLDYLKQAVGRLDQPIVMLNVLHNRTDLESLEACELEQILKGIENLLQQQADNIKHRLEAVLTQGGENA